MASRERRLDRAARLIMRDVAELGRELRGARLSAGLTLRAVADAVGVSASTILRLEEGTASGISVATLARHAAAVGLRARLKAYLEGAPIHAAGQVGLIRDFTERFPKLSLRLEVPVTDDPFDPRAFDATTRLGTEPCALEFLTRFRDTQGQLRPLLKKQSDAGIPRLIVVIRSTRGNRRAVAAAIDVMKDTFPAGTRGLFRALAANQDPGGNGIALL